MPTLLRLLADAVEANAKVGFVAREPTSNATPPKTASVVFVPKSKDNVSAKGKPLRCVRRCMGILNR